MEAVVTFEYEAQQDDELDLKVGEVIKDVQNVDEGWCEGTLYGKRGMFPDNFVQIREPSKPPPDAAPQIRAMSQSKKTRRAKVSFSYAADNIDELSLEPGQIVEVLAEEEEGWWRGKMGGKEGVFPSNFVEIIEEGVEPSQPAAPAVTSQPPPPQQSAPPPRPPSPGESAPPEPAVPKHVMGQPVMPKFDPSQALAKLKKSTNAEPKKPAAAPPASSVSRPPPPATVKAPPPDMPQSSSSKVVEKAKVTFEYDADNADELTIRVGEIVEIVNKNTDNDGWWEVRLGDRIGLIPDNFVDILPASPPSVRRPSASTRTTQPPPPQPQPEPKAPREPAVPKHVMGQPVMPKFDPSQALAKLKKSTNAEPKKPAAAPPASSVSRPPPPTTTKAPPPAMSQSNKTCCAKVSFSYAAEIIDELSLEPGQIVEVLAEEEEGWWRGKMGGKEGVFLSNFVEIIEGVAPSQPAAPAVTSQPPPPRPPSPGEKEAVVTFKYEAQEDDEFNLKVGDVIKDVHYVGLVGDGWCEGTLNGKRGMFPDNFVQIQEPSKPPPDAGPQIRDMSQSSSSKVVEKAKVTFEYDADNADELTIRVGEIVEIVNKNTDSDGWWEVRLGDRVGLVPDNFIEILPASLPSTPPPTAHSQPANSATDKLKADQSKKLFQEAMQSGYVVLHTIVLLLIGVAGAGKTCFCNILFDEPPPPVRESTPLAKSSIRAISFSRATVSQTEGAVFWKRVSAEMLNSLIADGIKSFIDFLSIPKSDFEHTESSKPGGTTEHIQVPQMLLSTSDDLKLRLVPPLSHTISTYEKYKGKDEEVAGTISHRQLSDIDQLFEMEPVKQLLEMISDSRGSVEIFRQVWLYIIDSGGQPQFHELLPTFVRHVSAVAFFVKLNETLANRPLIEYYSKGGVSACEPYQSSQTNLQVIQNCLQAMQTRCLVEKTAECPELFFIGTHRDLENKEEPLCVKDARLLEILHQHDIFSKHLAYYSLGSVDKLLYPVNAQTPSGADKEVVASFRQDVMEKCRKHERQIPIRWFVLESLLQKLSQDGVVSFKKCLEVASRLGMDEDRLRAAIEYLAQLNIFEFYPSVLPKVVFTTSQVLLTKVTELVEYSHFLRNRSVPHCSSEDKDFRDNGYLSLKFLEQERFSSHFVSGLFEAEGLLILLEDRLVVTRRDHGTFIMTSVLSELSPEKLDEHRLAISKSSTHVPIAVHYPGSLFPAGIFTSLVSHLQTTSNWKILMKAGKPVCLFKNCVDFIVRTCDLNANVTLFYTHQWIGVYARIFDDQQQACRLRSIVFDGLAHAAEIQRYSHIVPELVFLCPCEPGVSDQQSLPHIATVTPNKRCICCSCDENNCYVLTKSHCLWMKPSDGKEAGQLPKSDSVDKVPSAIEGANAAEFKEPSTSSSKALLVSDYQSRQLTINDLPQVFRAVFDARAKWYDIGLELNIDAASLDAIQLDNPHNAQNCLRDMLKTWLRRAHPKSTWGALMEALKSPLVDEGNLISKFLGQ